MLYAIDQVCKGHIHVWILNANGDKLVFEHCNHAHEYVRLDLAHEYVRLDLPRNSRPHRLFFSVLFLSECRHHQKDSALKSCVNHTFQNIVALCDPGSVWSMHSLANHATMLITLNADKSSPDCYTHSYRITVYTHLEYHNCNHRQNIWLKAINKIRVRLGHW